MEGGETFDQLQTRMKRAVFEIAAAHPGQTVAVFSHGTAIRCLQAALRGLGPGEMDALGHSDNTAVTCLRVEEGRAELVLENDNSHLPEEISTLGRQKWWKSQQGKAADANMWFCRWTWSMSRSGIWRPAETHGWTSTARTSPLTEPAFFRRPESTGAMTAGR